jgi:acid phosphatase family membrane protein YuiD
MAETAAAAAWLQETTAVAAVQAQVVLAEAIGVQAEQQAAARCLAEAARQFLRMEAIQQ